VDVTWVTCASDEQAQGVYNMPVPASACVQHNRNHHWRLLFIFVMGGFVNPQTCKPSLVFKNFLSNRPQVVVRFCFVLYSFCLFFAGGEQILIKKHPLPQ